ncbi:GNAT family N-acetyltransferase [Mangrovibacillus cuniculi]|uniref:GNAT family N-acetyltransferase n=1 Tax=Mangrovibacillus cuniculi TaxID=2593652 RepID=A0A7S8C8Y4_9BACI|nr:GNAT family N-acetyltransferase [Mangrovibacillus cuniculi]QPC45587.1 GNAT family N-acetyltransferase [Mangrovibacillus cuniculi]
MNVRDSNVQNIKLRPLTIDDFSSVLEWSKDEKFCLASNWELHRDEQEVNSWWQHFVSSLPEDFIRLALELENKLIGYVDLACMKGTEAELGIAIGDSSQWGKGIGFNASISMMDYASKQLGITVFNAETHEINVRSRRMLEKIGFREVSRIGSEVYLGTESQLIQYRFEISSET